MLYAILVGGSTTGATLSRKRKSDLVNLQLDHSQPLETHIANSYPLLLPKSARVGPQGDSCPAVAVHSIPTLPPNESVPTMPLLAEADSTLRRCCGKGSRCCDEGQTTCACCPLPEDADLLLSLSVPMSTSSALSSRCCVVPCHGPPVIVKKL